MKSKVSILVPVYGVEKYIERCARSLFEQTFEDIEYIFVDDCSPDRSIENLKKVMDDYPHRKQQVQIICHEHNKGLAGARNTAVDNCQTEFLMHVDSDDWIDKDTISECMRIANNDRVDIVTIGLERVKGKKSSVDKVEWSSDTKEMTRRVIVHEVHNGICGRLIRTSLYKDYNIKVEVGRGMSEDLQVSPRLFYYAKDTAYTDKVFYHYITNDTSYTSSFSMEKFRHTMMAFKLLEDFFEDKEFFLKNAVIERKIGSYQRGIIDCAKQVGNKNSFLEIKKRLAMESKIYTPNLSFGDRVILSINNYSLLRIILVCASVIKKMSN